MGASLQIRRNVSNCANKYAIPLIISWKRNIHALLWLICCCNSSMTASLKLEAPWEEVKEKLKEVNTDLTDNDLRYQQGQEE